MAGLLIQNLSRNLFAIADENGGKLKNRVVFYCDELGTMGNEYEVIRTMEDIDILCALCQPPVQIPLGFCTHGVFFLLWQIFFSVFPLCTTSLR